jgi:microcystin-dependent protein
MSTAYVGEIRVVAFNFAPTGWQLCNGQLLQISEYTALFSLLGTQYGGDGITTFALPNLQSRVAVGTGQGPGLSAYYPGQSGGEVFHTLTVSEMPVHAHNIEVRSAPATTTNPSLGIFAEPASALLYGPAHAGSANSHSIGATGGGESHQNMAPFLVMNFIISLYGVFPSRG